MTSLIWQRMFPRWFYQNTHPVEGRDRLHAELKIKLYGKHQAMFRTSENITMQISIVREYTR
jgi:hypothetical protein